MRRRRRRLAPIPDPPPTVRVLRPDELELPDELVARAVIARGHAPDHGGIGAAMRAALRSVAHDLAALVHPDTTCPHCPHRATDPVRSTRP